MLGVTCDAFAEGYLKASNTDEFDRFGESIAISGDTIVVGASYESSDAAGVGGDAAGDSLSGSGAAYVFVRSGTTWTQQAYLKAANADGGDYFGWSVAIDGDMIAVGASSESSGSADPNDNFAFDAGATYVFGRSGTTWTQQGYLKASNAEQGDLFGYSVDIDGDTIVVGAIAETGSDTGVDGDEHDNAANGAGAVYVFVHAGGAWSQQAYLKASNTGTNDFFGHVAISGDTIVVGARYEDSNAVGVDGNDNNNSSYDSGAAYVFVRSGATWTQQAYLKASNTGSRDQFGWPVAIDGDTIVVGARTEDSNAVDLNGLQSNNSTSDSGAAYVFVRSGTTWVQQAYIKASNTGWGDAFGSAVAIDGGTCVIAANLEDSNAVGVDGNQSNNSSFDSGAVYVRRIAP